MATKLKGKTSKSLFPDDDLLDSLFDDKKQPARGRVRHGGMLNRSSATDNIFSMLADDVKRDAGDTEDSDVSAADPNDILKNMKDMDDMDADLFALKKKPSLASVQTKVFRNEGPKKDSPAIEGEVKPEGADEPNKRGKKPSSALLSATREKFAVSDNGGGDDDGLGQTHQTKDGDDPLGDLLDDLLKDEIEPQSKSSVQQAKSGKSTSPSSPSPIPKSETPKAVKGRADLTFDDDKDGLMDALGFDSDKNNPKKKEAVLLSNKERVEPPQRARSRIEEILENLTSPRLQERPPTGERKELPQCQEKQQRERPSVGKESLVEDDVTFGTYQPTLVSTPEGRQSRRQSVRFSTEDVASSTPEKKPKSTTPTSSRHHNSADWLGLKTNDEHTFLESDAKGSKTPAEFPKTPSSPLLERRPSLTGSHTTSAAAVETPTSTDNITEQNKLEASKRQRREEGEDGWLAGALSRKKNLSVSKSETKSLKQEDSLGLGEEVDLESVVSKQAISQAPRGTEASPGSVKGSSNSFLGQPSPTAYSTPVREQRNMQAVPQQNQMQNASTAVQQQVTLSADSLQQLLLQQQMMQSQLLSLGGVMDAGGLQRLREKEQQPCDYRALQARIIQLEGQVKTLQLERDQSQMLLETVQQRHKQDMELIESTHKARVKLLEESAAHRETQARQECEDLIERLATVTRSAEQEHSELQAQYQRKLAQAQQDRDREVDRLRDLQRKSILEMKKDHEDQVQRLKKLKDEEIDAVTSATSQTRSLTAVIEQMEQFSSRLGELSSRVESTHEHTAHGLEEGARHRDEQLRMMQDRLAQQQRAMVEERAYLKEIISRMDTQISEQQRQLEKERWKMTAEQAKAESTQRSVEEERRAVSMQISMEREELERAKSKLLEEQKSVMQQCAEERRKLAAEWTHFHALEKQRRDRAEQEVSSLLEKREGSIISLAQEQADLKLHTAELKQKEKAVAQERESLERLREELEREKERISSTALRLKTRVQEVEAFSKLAAEKHEEGERALQEAKRVEAEHRARLTNIHTQAERLRQQEQRILQERMHLGHLRKEAQRLRQDPTVTSLHQMIPPILPVFSADAGSLSPKPELPSNLSVPPPASCSNSQAMALQASLALWRYTAEKDREFLQEEQIFLDNLKKKSYRSSTTN